MKYKKHPIRNTAIAIIIFTVIAFGTSYYFQSQNAVSKIEFEKSHKFLNKRIDTVINNQKEIQRKLDSIIIVTGNIDKNQAMQILKIDSILQSQKMIYKEISGKNWAEQILKWLE